MSADTNGDKMITLNEAFNATYSAVRNAGKSQYTRVNPSSSSFVLFGRS